ncbi:hypothetical protein [Streptomyces niger]|uniref:hypothetical protein n=1 Tax=Streptomyces niger TaxID=66373 RepID=UPI00069A3385|nr:hypothetical protein [Streptomyces niger]
MPSDSQRPAPATAPPASSEEKTPAAHQGEAPGASQQEPPATSPEETSAAPEEPFAECVLCRAPTEYPESTRGIVLCPRCEWEEAQRTACSG